MPEKLTSKDLLAGTAVITPPNARGLTKGWVFYVRLRGPEYQEVESVCVEYPRGNSTIWPVEKIQIDKEIEGEKA